MTHAECPYCHSDICDEITEAVVKERDRITKILESYEDWLYPCEDLMDLIRKVKP